MGHKTSLKKLLASHCTLIQAGFIDSSMPHRVRVRNIQVFFFFFLFNETSV